MSRFFAASDSESETSSSEDELQQRPVAQKPAFQWSDEEEETKRVVRSAKDKRYEELRNIIKTLKNHKKIKDMANVLSDFEDLGKAYDKAKKVVEKEGIPRFYVRCLTELDDFVSECWEDRDGRKAMSKNNAKGLTTLRQKLRKYNRDFETHIAKYRENPDVGEEDEEEEAHQADSDSDDDDGMDGADFFKKGTAPAKTETKSVKFLKGEDDDDDDDDDDSSFWGTDSDSDDSDSDDPDKYDGNLAAMFLKKDDDKKKDKKKDVEKSKAKKEKKMREMEEDDDEEPDGEGWQKVTGGPSSTQERPKMFSKDAEINHEAVMKKLYEITAARGKKATDRQDQISLLKELRGIAATNNLGCAIDVKILFNIISAIYDYNPNIATCMKNEMWEQCLVLIDELLTLLMSHLEIMVGENVSDDSEHFDGEPPYRVRGCVLAVLERMDEEFIKMLQACDAHSTEYVDRLKDEREVCLLFRRLQKYIESRGTTEEICRIYLKRIEHLYYKFDGIKKQSSSEESLSEEKTEENKPEEEKAEETIKQDGETEKTDESKAIEELTEEQKAEKERKRLEEEELKIPEDSKVVMDKWCKYIYAKDNTDRIRTRAILCHIYHHALHDRWFEARDLMLMSHLQDTIQHSDIPTQIMYNRGMVQLGLCAFRQGMIRDAHNCLVDIQSGGRAKELLAQGLLLQRQHERTPEQEKIEKRRQMPYHMHINLELLECVYLVSAMLLEIPYMAAHEFDARRRMISKNFHHVLRVSDRQPLVGPPESMREHVVAASKAMKNGDYKACANFIINEKMNAKVWDLFHKKDHVRDLIVQKIKEESLRTYLFTYSSVYDSLSLATLAEMFDMEKAVAHSIISKMIINEELMASLDEPTHTVMMHRTEPTRLQSLALQLSEKVASLVENNERIMEMKQGTYFSFQGKGKPGQDGGGYQRGGYQQRDRGDGGGYKGGYGRDRDRGNYHGNRDRDRGNYHGNRDNYQGNRDNYHGNRDNYHGNRDRGNYNNQGGNYRNRRDNRDRDNKGDRY